MYKLTYRWGHWLFILALAAFIGAAFGLRPLHLTGSQYWSDIPVWTLPLGMLVLSFVPAFLWKGQRNQMLLVGLTNLSAMFFFATLTNLTGDPILKNPDGLIVNYVSIALAIVGGLLTTFALCSTSLPLEAKAAAPVQPAAKAAVEGHTPAPVKEEQPSLQAETEAAKESTPLAAASVAASVAAASVAAEAAPASKDVSPASVAPASKDASVTDSVASKEASASQTQLKAVEPEKPKGLGGSQLGAKAAASTSGVKLQSLLEKLDPEMKAASPHKPSIKSASPAASAAASASAPAVPGSGTAKASETSTNLPDQKKAASTTATRLQAQKRKSTATFSKLQALSASGTGTTTRSTASPADESSDSLKSILDRLDTKGGFDQYDGPEDILSPNESLLTPPEVAEANRPVAKFADMPKPAAKPEEPKKPVEKTKPAESGKSFARSESGKLDSGKLDPAQLDSGKLDSARLDSAKLDSAKLDSAKLDSAKLDPAQLDSAKLDSAKLDSAKVDSAKVDSAKVDPIKPEPAVKPQPVKPAQPAKAEIVKIETAPAAKTPPVKPAPLESVTAPKPAEGPSLSSMLDAMESKMPKSEEAGKSELSAAGGDAAAEAQGSDKGYTNEELHAIPTPKVAMAASGTPAAARTSEEPQTEFAPPAEGPKPDIVQPDTTAGAEAAAESATTADTIKKEPDAKAESESGSADAIAADISAVGNADYKFGTAETVAKIEAAAEIAESTAKTDATASGAAASDAGITDNLFGSKIDQDIDDIFSNLVPAEAQREVQGLKLEDEARAAGDSETPASFIELRSDKEEEKVQAEAEKAAEPEPTKAATATTKTPAPEPGKAATAKTPPTEPAKAADETAKVTAPEPTKAAAPANDNLFGTQIDQDIDDIFSAIVPIEAQKEVKESPYSLAYGEKEEAAPTPEPVNATISTPAEIPAVAKETAQPEAKAEATKAEATGAAEVVAPAPTTPREEEKPAAEQKRKDTLFDPSLEKDLDDLFSAFAPEDAHKNVSNETLAKFKPADQEPISFQPASPQPEEKALVEQEPSKFNETLHHLPGIQGTVESLLNNLAGAEGMPGNEAAEAPAAERGEGATAEPAKSEPPAPLNAMDLIESLAAESKAEKSAAAKAEAEPARVEIEPTKVEAEPAKAEIEPAKVAAEPAKAEIEPAKVAAEPAKVEIESTKVAAEPAKAEIEPAKVAAEPAKVEIESTKVEAEPAKAAIEPMKAEAQPVLPAPEPVETAQAAVATSDTEPADPRDTAQKIEAIKAQAEAHALTQSEPADEQAQPEAQEEGEPIEGEVPFSMRSTVDIGQALKDAEKSKQLTALEKQLKEFGRLSTKSTKPQADEPVGTMKTIGKLLIEVQAVENIIKTGEATGKLGSGLSTARVISAARGEGIKALLTKIDSYSGKVKGSVIVGHDGLVIASTLPPDMNQDALGALSMASIGTSNMATKKLEIGKLRQMVLITDRNISVLTDVDVGILSVFLDDVSIDLVDGLIDAIHETIHG